MGTYYIPRNVKGETRILYIFSIKSLITTMIGGAVGLIFYLIFLILGLTTLGWIFLGIFALIGFIMRSYKNSNSFRITNYQKNWWRIN